MVWQAWLLSKATGTRPCDLYVIDGEFRRFCFDRAIVTFGTALEAELDGVSGKTEKAREVKRSRMLDRWLDRPLKYRSISAPTKGSSSGPTPSTDVEKHTMPGDGSEAR